MNRENPFLLSRVLSRPFSIVPTAELWCVHGTEKFTDAGGVICWCYDEVDAADCLRGIEETGLWENCGVSRWEDL